MKFNKKILKYTLNFNIGNFIVKITYVHFTMIKYVKYIAIIVHSFSKKKKKKSFSRGVFSFDKIKYTFSHNFENGKMKIKHSETIQSLKSISNIEKNKNLKQKLVFVLFFILFLITVFYLLKENISFEVKLCHSIYFLKIKRYEIFLFFFFFFPNLAQ
jgi:hypothetical protein